MTSLADRLIIRLIIRSKVAKGGEEGQGRRGQKIGTTDRSENRPNL